MKSKTPIIGIYKIENLINHKIYIGQSTDIERRFREHCSPSSERPIDIDIQKYGKENFSFEIICECQENELSHKEGYYICKFNTIAPNGYNVIRSGYMRYLMMNLIKLLKDYKKAGL